ncbi:hypothetical protein GVAV_003091 [Gurleya vavrai]
MSNRAFQSCEHYKRNCSIVADCCLQTYPCRLCHDEHETHKLDRYKIKYMICHFCGIQQEPMHNCQSCCAKLADFFCDICKFWYSKKDSVFHCIECNVCRKGKKEDFIHCLKCNACIEKRSEHKHISNTLDGDCPVCAENLFQSVRDVIMLKCGHSMHFECFEFYSIKFHHCPVCTKTTGDMNNYDKKVDMILEKYGDLQQNSFNYKCYVLCSECQIQSPVYYRYMFNRCPICKSYNTRVWDLSRL